MDRTDPLISQRLHQYQATTAAQSPDIVLAQTQALRNLNQVVTREAQVRAYNDVIALNGLFAVVLLIWGLFIIVRMKIVARRMQT